MKHWILIITFILVCTGGWAQSGELFIFNWTEYLPDSVIEQFQNETGIKVNYSTFESNESMFAKVKLLKGSGYDLVVPSTYFVNRMRNEGLIQKIDRAKIKRFDNLDPRLLNQSYDPGNEYSIPYLWGTTGLCFNSKVVDKNAVTNWADLWRPEFKNKVLLTDDVREVFHMALRTLGYSGNTTNTAEIEQAYEKLKELMPNVRVFNSESPKLPYLNGEVSVGMNWNGEAYTANQENPDIQYVYPKEGAAVWVDNLVILKEAKNVEAAHRFIDFILQPEIAKTISEEIGYASPNVEAVKLLDEAVRQNRTVYPMPEDLVNAEFQTDIGDDVRVVYEKYWEKLKSEK